MPRFFFDVFDRELIRDTEGTECSKPEDVRVEAMRALPQIAKDRIPTDGDRQAFTILVRNEANVTIYTATLTFAGLWLGDEIPPSEPPDL